MQTYISKLRLEGADELRVPSAVAVAGQLCELLDLLLVGGDAGVLDLAAAPPGDIAQAGTGLLVAQVKNVAQGVHLQQVECEGIKEKYIVDQVRE